jgi:hypothetical protein
MSSAGMLQPLHELGTVSAMLRPTIESAGRTSRTNDCQLPALGRRDRKLADAGSRESRVDIDRSLKHRKNERCIQSAGGDAMLRTAFSWRFDLEFHP